ncbi:MAG: major capsid protein [Terrestrivirus sp.]|uniref:Major capsid protein n=1 Tax=Terrestrivirus sp. TaxID=2487775 RepID=A0A3G4ZRH7_9VIRU|nr:MAG: major capsid protein [Terrestrivirus sp.]
MDYLCNLLGNSSTTICQQNIINNKQNEQNDNIKNKKLYFDNLAGGLKYHDYYDDTMYDSRRKALENKQYSCSQIEQHCSGNPASGRRTTLTITRNGDYCEMPVLRLKMEKEAACLHADNLLESIELEIGGSQIDKIYGCNLDILLHLYKLKHDVVELDDDTICHYIPLPFDIFVGKNILPLVLLSWFEVRINLKFNEFPCELIESSVLFDYVSINCELTKKIDTDGEVCNVLNYSNDITIPKTIGILQTCYTGDETIILNTNNDNTSYKFKLAFNHETLLLYFFLTSNNERITENLVNKVSIKLNDKYCCEYDKPELLYNSKKILDMPGVYCLPFVPSKDFNNIQSNIRGSINLTYIDSAVLSIQLNKKVNDYKEYDTDDLRINIFTLCKNKLHFYDGRGELVNKG